MRASGRNYEDLEAEGTHLVVSKIACQYLRPCRFGDAIRLRTNTVRARGARIDHEYEVFRGEELLARGNSTIACIDHHGRVQRLPDWLAEEG
jgi:acyl-CoA thioester hydrolase